MRSGEPPMSCAPISLRRAATNALASGIGPDFGSTAVAGVVSSWTRRRLFPIEWISGDGAGWGLPMTREGAPFYNALTHFLAHECRLHAVTRHGQPARAKSS